MKDKYCPRCKETLPMDRFYTDAARDDGMQIYCMPCARERARIHSQTPKGIKSRREKGIRMYWKHKAKMLARAQARYAVKTGKLVKPTVCSRCPETNRIEGHHPDYSKPLEVIWLCDPCHKHEHGKLTDKTMLKTGANHAYTK